MRRSKNQIKFLINILMLIIFLIGNTSQALYQTNEIKNPNKIIMENVYTPVVDNVNFLDPAITFDYYMGGLVDFSYEALIIEDWKNKGTFLGVLAENWTLSDNGTIYTFNLKKNIKFHDGTPFNAYTMKYSIDRMMIINDKGSAVGPLLQPYILGGSELKTITDLNITQAKNYLNAGGVIVKDEFTLQIKINKPFQPFLSILAVTPKAISPYSVVTNHPANYTTDQTDDLWGMVSLNDIFPAFSDWTKLGLPSNHNPKDSGIVPQADRVSVSVHTWTQFHMVGTGPYKLETLNSDKIIFLKYTNWQGTFVQNSVDEIQFLTEADADQRELHLRLGEIDMFQYVYGSMIPKYIDSKGNSLIPGTKAYMQPSLVTSVILFNFKDNLTHRVVPTSDIEKTWNLTHIENSHLVRYSNNETFLASLDNPFTSLLFRKAFAYSFDYQTYIDETYNGVMARMGEGIIPFGMVGHQDQLREKKFIPDFDLIQAKTLFQEVGWRGNITFRLGKIPVPEVINAYNIIKADIESLNVGININIMNVNDLNNSQALDRLNSPMYVMGWSADYNDPYNMVFAMLHSNGDYAGYVNYRNPELDQLIDQTEYESDFDTRMALFKQIEELTAKDYANIYTVYKKRAYIVKDWLTNIEESGSLDPMSSYLKFQYISKGKTSTTSTGNKIYY